MKKCPCCDKNTLKDEQVMNSLSRVDNETYICNTCGDNEGFINYDPSVVDQDAIDIHERFKMRLRGE